MKTAPAPAELPPELAELQQLAGAADAAIAGSADPNLQPGAADPAADDGKADELGAMLELGFKAAGKVLPPLPKYFDHDACLEIGTAYLECAEKYGWTWHEKVAGPEVRLGAAIVVPAFMAYMETKAWIEWQREQKNRAAAGERLEPLPAVPAT